MFCLYFGFLSDCLDADMFHVMNCWYWKPTLFPSLNWFSNCAPLLGKVPLMKVGRPMKGTRKRAR